MSQEMDRSKFLLVLHISIYVNLRCFLAKSLLKHRALGPKHHYHQLSIKYILGSVYSGLKLQYYFLLYCLYVLQDSEL
jgi:hypothetical protein